MAEFRSGLARRAAATSLLAILSAVPYAMIYVIDRALGVANAARSALWPTAIAPVLVAAVLAAYFVHDSRSRQPKLAAVRPLPPRRRAHERAA